MKLAKWKYFAAAAALFVALVAFLWKPLRFDEPWYSGKSLTMWLEEYGEGPRDYKPSTNADEAIRQIGSRAVPVLLGLLHTTNSVGRILHTNNPSAGRFVTFRLTTAKTNVSLKARVQNFIEKHTSFRFHGIPRPPSWSHWKAFLGFQALGPRGRDAIPELARLARDPSGTSTYPTIGSTKNISLIAGSATSSRTYLAPDDSQLMGTLLRNTNDFLVDGEIAAWSLAAIGGDAITPLSALLKDPNPRLRMRGIAALGLMGPDVEPAIPAITAFLADSDRDIRMRAADSLGWICLRPDVSIPPLIQSLSDTDVGVRFYSAEALGKFGTQASNAIPVLLRNSKDGDYRIRQSAAVALSRISPQTATEQVLPSYLAELKHPDFGYRNSALLAVMQMREQAGLVVPAIMELLDDTNQMVRGNAIIALGQFGAESKAALPRLLQMTNDPDSLMRMRVTNALRLIQQPSPATTPTSTQK